MSVQFTSNNTQAQMIRHIEPIYEQNRASKNLQNSVTLDEQPDTFYNSKTAFNECLVRKNALGVNSIGLFTRDYILSGAVNNKGVELYKSKQSGAKTFSGHLGDDKVEVLIKGKDIKGNVGDKEIDLRFKKGIFGNFSITGTIGGKDIHAKKGGSIDDICGENDIITMLSALKGKEVTIKNGTFKSLGMSTQSRTDFFSIMGQIFWDILEPVILY